VRTGQARKRDANEAAIVKALRQIGAEVFPLSGRGIPDVLVRYRGAVYAFEIKSATGKRTEAQVDTQWPVIRSIQEALAAVGVR
jgi:Holliday junction resolvase